MSSFKLDTTNNLVVLNNFVFVNGDEQLLQDCKNLISLFIKENPFNVNEGIDYLDLLQNNNIKAIIDKIISIINNDERVNNCLVELIRDDVNVKLNVTIINKKGDELGFII